MRLSPLDRVHRERDAKMVAFGGWEMPLVYPSGTLFEHRACREAVAIFDVSHLGTVRVSGANALDTLQSALTNDLNKISPGRAQYTHLCNDSGGVLDDIIVWWIEDTVFDVMPNASNTSRVIQAVGGTDTTSSRAIIAVQGPRARACVAGISAEASEVGRFRVGQVDISGVPCVVAGTGYTGEDGVEISVPADAAGNVWSALEECGAVPAGLGARDTLRLEAALPLHGHELGPEISPLQAGLGWVVAWSKPGFFGRDALMAERERGPHRILRGLAFEGRRPAREGSEVRNSRGDLIGSVTSGNFSPTLGHCISLALLSPDVATGDEVYVDVRGTTMSGRVVSTPFVKKTT